MTDTETPAADPHAAVIEQARKDLRLSADAEAKIRKLQLDDKKFAAGEHWPEKLRALREQDGRPVLTIDRLGPQIKQVTNQLRQNRPSIQVIAVENGDVETAEVFQGLCRHTESISDADVAYDRAGEDAATIGRGWFRIITEYDTEDGDTQEIKIKRVRNPFSVYPDPTCQEIDYSDARFFLITEDLTRDDYLRLYPDSKAAAMTDFSGIGNDEQYWFWAETVRIAEYWYVETTKRTITLAKGKTREVEDRKIYCKKINGVEVLEEYEWAGKYLPFVPVIAEEVDIAGQVDYRGITRRSKDPQRMLNIWKSATTEMIALAPKAPYIMAEGQDEGYERMWKQANIRNFPALKYKPLTVAGTMAPAPRREVAEPPIQALLASTTGAENDLRATTSFYDVGDQERREQSGRAILARQKQGEIGNSDVADGLRRAIRFAARILIDLYPKIYDAPRIRRIIGNDGKEKTVVVHAGQQQAADVLQGDGIAGVYDLSAGRYDVAVGAGPSHQTARQELSEFLANLFQAQPGLFQVFGDVFFENQDAPMAKQMAKRSKKMLPPELQDDDGAQAQIPPQVQMQMAQMQQQLQQMGAALQEAESGIAKTQLEVQSKERIAAAELSLKAQIAQMEADVAKFKATLDANAKQAAVVAETERAVLKIGAEIEAQARDQAHQAVEHEADLRHADRQAQTSHIQALEQQASKPDADRSA